MFGAAAQILPGMLQKRVVGVVGRLPYDPLEYCILAASTAIAWAFCVELNFVIFYTFRRRSGLYFWSLIISSWGCIFHALGFILKFLTLTPPGGFLPFIEIGTEPTKLLRYMELNPDQDGRPWSLANHSFSIRDCTLWSAKD